MTKRTKNILRRTLLVILGIILGINVYLLNAKTVGQNALPMPFGIGGAVVQSGSMEPTLNIGDLLLVQEQSEYNVGDIVVYQAQNELIVHRIVAMQNGYVLTQGDANNVSDNPFSEEAIRGVVVASIPGIGYVVDALKTPFGVIVLLACAILLVELSFRSDVRHAKHDEKTLRMRAMQKEINEIKRSLGESGVSEVSEVPEVPDVSVPASEMAEASETPVPEMPETPEISEASPRASGTPGVPGALNRTPKTH